MIDERLVTSGLAGCSSEVLLARLDALVPELDALALPGQGRTLDRWRAFVEIARSDLSLVRLAEGHADARAILAELGHDAVPAAGARLGVWAAQPDRLGADATASGWRLSGSKGWCSGAKGLDRALVTATTSDGPRLFLVDVQDPRISAQAGSWTPTGMVGTNSLTIWFDDVPLGRGDVVGGPGAYVDRAGFGHGGAGVAACWWGGALGLVDALRRAVIHGGPDLLGPLGEATADLEAGWSCLTETATAIDAAPTDQARAGRGAARARLVIGLMARRTLHLVTDALGSAALCHDPDHSRRVADLAVYLSQLSPTRAARDYGRIVSTAGLDRW